MSFNQAKQWLNSISFLLWLSSTSQAIEWNMCQVWFIKSSSNELLAVQRFSALTLLLRNSFFVFKNFHFVGPKLVSARCFWALATYLSFHISQRKSSMFRAAHHYLLWAWIGLKLVNMSSTVQFSTNKQISNP